MFTRFTKPLLLAGLLPACALGVTLKAPTVSAFDGYVWQAEVRISLEERSHDRFLHLDANSNARLRQGEILVEPIGEVPTEIPNGLVHDWVGIVFIPGATLAQTLSLVQDYDRLARFYNPEVLSSRLLSRSGNDFRMTMRVRKHKAVTVVLDADYQVHYGALDATHRFSESRSTRMEEVADHGTANERMLPESDSHGFLWRLNTYWRFVEVADGVYVQCEAISLTRDVPAGLGWLIGPFILNIPRESLQFTLDSTRKGVLERARAAQ